MTQSFSRSYPDVTTWTFPQRLRVAADYLREAADYLNTHHPERLGDIVEPCFSADGLEAIAEEVELQDAQHAAMDALAEELYTAMARTSRIPWPHWLNVDQPTIASYRAAATDLVRCGWHKEPRP